MVKGRAGGMGSGAGMGDKVGEYVEKGALICVIENLESLQVEIVVREDEVFGVQPGRRVELKARALPFETFVAEIERIAPSAVSAAAPVADAGNHQNSVVVHCRVDNRGLKLKSGMTGF